MIYSPVVFTGDLSSPLCVCNLPDPVINSFSVDFAQEKIRAGTGEILKIFGNNFGDVIMDNNSYIEVENADHIFPLSDLEPGWSDEDRTRIPLEDIINWNNNEISFTVPSTTLGAVSAPVQSGDLKVFTECGSDDKRIDVEYAVLNIRESNENDGIPYRVALENQTENGIQFSFASNVGEIERNLTIFAVNAWCNETNIGWSVINGNSTANSIASDDGINLVIEVDPASSPFIKENTAAGVVVFGETSQGENFIESCNEPDDNVPLAYYVRNIDVVINQNINFNDMPSQDRQQIFLHEFGHAHLLGHASRLFGTDPQNYLMFYSDGGESIKPADFNGAFSVFAASSAILINNNSENCPNPIQAVGCPNNTDEVEMISDIIISPNPFNTKVMVEFSSSINKNLELKIFSITGALLIEKSVYVNQKVELTDLDMLNSGLYFLEIQSSTHTWNGKIIKN